MINQTLIKSKLAEVRPYLSKIQEFSTVNDLDNLDNQLMSERLFEILSQIILDICTHISANSDFGPPQTYASCMDNLNKLSIIEDSKLPKFKDLIRMRNLIVHQYGDIDYELLFNGLKKIESDFVISLPELYRNLQTLMQILF